MMTKRFYVDALIVAAAMWSAGQVMAGGTVTSTVSHARVSADADHDSHSRAGAPGAVCPPGTVPVCLDDDGLDEETRRQRLLTMGAVGLGGAFVLKAVGGVTKDVVSVGRIRDIPIYGKAITNIPNWPVKVPMLGCIRTEVPLVGKVPLISKAPLIGNVSMIGKAAGKVTVPTTLGQTPYLGKIIKDIPLVGKTIAGPANPIIVGAVAIDTYWLPKIAPCGYTESAFFTETDFNSEPKLRHYVNYLAPLPYTHPPIYASSTLNSGRVPNTGESSMDNQAGAVVKIPE